MQRVPIFVHLTIGLNKNLLNHLFRPDDQLVREHSRSTVVNPGTDNRGPYGQSIVTAYCVFIRSFFYKPYGRVQPKR